MLKITGLTIEFNGYKVLEDVSFYAYPGKIHLIKGNSGSGKTTLLYRIALLSNQRDYQYTVDDASVFDDLNYSNQIAYISQEYALLNSLNVGENISFAGRMYGKELDEQELKDVLKEVKLSVPLDQEIQNLSSGEQQRLAIACAVVKGVQILVLDEPTSALDKENEENIYKLLQDISVRYHITVIYSSHRQKAEEYADVVYEINDHKLVCTEHLKEEKSDIPDIHKNVDVDYYYRHTIKKNIGAYIRNIMIILIAMVTMLSVFTVLYNNGVNSVKTIEELSDNEILLTSKNDDIYGDSEIIDEITLNQGTQYPYVTAYIMVNDQRIDIIPYTKDNNLDSRVWKSYVKSSQAYLSYDVYRYFTNHNYPFQQLNMLITYEGEKQIHLLNTSTSGILKQGVQNAYTGNTYFIYMPYDALMKLYTGNSYNGYIVYGNSVEELEDIVDECQNLNVDINNTFSNLDARKKVNNQTRISMIIFGCIFTVLATVILFVILLHEYNKRHKEFTTLMINGFSNKNISNLISKEICLYFKIPVLIFMFVILISYFLSKTVSLLTAITVLLFVFVFVLCQLYFRNHTKSYALDKMLREN